MIDPVIVYPWNYCHNCKTQSIELYSWHNYPQKYQKIIDLYNLSHTVSDNLNKYSIYTMRCSRCGREYKIYWDENGFPKPIYGNFITDFFYNKFKSESIHGRPKIIDNIYEERLKE